jgi:hypothetical protein
MPSEPTRLDQIAHLLTLTAEQAGALTGYSKKQVQTLAKTGGFPPPVNPDLDVYWWRWSRRRLELWADGHLDGAA